MPFCPSTPICLFVQVHKYVIYLFFANKQLLDEVEHDIENYQGRSLHYPPKAEVDNTNRGLDNCR